MTIFVPLQNEALKSYSHTDDAHVAFNNAVGNGQARLAMDVLRELLDGIIAKISELEDKLNGGGEIVTPAAAVEEQDSSATVKPKATQKKAAAPSKEDEEEKVPAEA
jgi:hypothetical protein